MPSQSSEPIFVAAREQAREKVSRARSRRGREHVFQQDGMTLLQPRGEQAKRRDHRQIEAVADGHQTRGRLRVEPRESRLVARVDLHHAGLFIHQLGLVIAHALQLMRDLVEPGLPHEYAHRFLAAQRYACEFADAASGGAGKQKDRTTAAPRRRVDPAAFAASKRPAPAPRESRARCPR